MGRLKIHQSAFAILLALRRIVPSVLPSPLLAAAALGACLVAGCADEHRVSPWGGRAMPPLSAFIESPDLTRSLRAIDSEAASAGLRLLKTIPARGRDGTAYEVRAYEGRDRLGRPSGAIRVASPWGVVLALGPLEEADRPRPTRYVAAMPAADSSIVFPADLTGDGNPEIVLQSDRDGRLAIYSLAPRGATELRVALAHEPLGLRLANKGYALWTRAPIASQRTLEPRFERIATYRAGAFSEDTEEARAFHRVERDQPAPEGESTAQRLTRVLDRSFHAARAEAKPNDRKPKLEVLKNEPVPAELAAEWKEWLLELEREATTP